MRKLLIVPFVCGVLAAALAPVGASAADHKIDCEMTFNLSSWAAIVKHAEGSGVITCDNGARYKVGIVARGGGLTVGKSHIDNGHGKFSEVGNVEELFGTYAQGEANAGVVRSGMAQVVTKGTVSLALAGSGEGVDLGVSFGEFVITREK